MARGSPPNVSQKPCTLDRAVADPNLYDVAVIGAGYVGLPLAVTFAEAGGRVLVIDVQPRVVEALNGGTSHIEDITSDRLAALVDKGLVVASTDYEQCKHAHAVLIALLAARPHSHADKQRSRRRSN